MSKGETKGGRGDHGLLIYLQPRRNGALQGGGKKEKNRLEKFLYAGRREMKKCRRSPKRTRRLHVHESRRGGENGEGKEEKRKKLRLAGWGPSTHEKRPASFAATLSVKKEGEKAGGRSQSNEEGARISEIALNTVLGVVRRKGGGKFVRNQRSDDKPLNAS